MADLARWRWRTLAGAGVLMGLSAVAHAFGGWPAFRAALGGLGAESDVMDGLAAGWYWGSIAMAVFAVMAIDAAIRLRRGDVGALASIRIVGAGYVLFGAGAFVAYGHDAHFLLFAVTGLLLLVPAVVGRTNRRT